MDHKTFTIFREMKEKTLVIFSVMVKYDFGSMSEDFRHTVGEYGMLVVKDCFLAVAVSSS